MKTKKTLRSILTNLINRFNSQNLFIKFIFISAIFILFQVILKFCTNNHDTFINYLNNSIKVAAFFCAIHELNLTQKSYSANNDYLRKKHAVDLAKYYEEELLKKASIFSNLYSIDDSNYSQFIKSIDERSMVAFDIDELKEIYDDKKDSYDFKNFDSFIEGYKRISKETRFQNNFCKTNYMLSPTKENREILLQQLQVEDFSQRKALVTEEVKKLKQEVDTLEPNIKDGKKEKAEDLRHKLEDIKFLHLEIAEKQKELQATISPIFQLDLERKIDSEKEDLLNKLEHFSMNFHLEIADEKAVYPSLHQTFRAVVKNLYIEISLRNEKSTEKYYTNIISLFHLWNSRCNNEKEKEQKRKAELKEESTFKAKAWNYN